MRIASCERGADDEAGDPTSEVRPFIIDLPVGESDPEAQLDAIAKQTRNLKMASAVLGAEMIMAVSEWTPSGHTLTPADLVLRDDGLLLVDGHVLL